MEVALVFVDVVQGFTFVQNSENRLAERGKNYDGSEHIHTSFLKEAVMVKTTGLASIASDRGGPWLRPHEHRTGVECQTAPPCG